MIPSIPSFMQFHTLHTYPVALINRDDAGLAKRAPIGGVDRGRVSSQCLKQAWRSHEGPDGLCAIGAPNTIRSRELFERMLVEPLVKEGYDLDLVRQHVSVLRDLVLGRSEAKEKKKDKDKSKSGTPPVHTEQVVVMGRPEVDYLLTVAMDALVKGVSPTTLEAALGRDGLKNIRELHLGGGISAALFGRMVTSDLLSRCDSAINVAHSITTHAIETEPDYFSAVDELTSASGQLGSGHIGISELTSGIYYGYVVVDMAQLVMNLTGCSRAGWRLAARDSAASQVLDHVLGMICTVSPGAKRGSTAPYSYARLAIVEMGDQQPRSLAGAFHTPIPTQGDMVSASVAALAREIRLQDKVYGSSWARRSLIVAEESPIDPIAPRAPLAGLRRWTATFGGA